MSHDQQESGDSQSMTPEEQKPQLSTSTVCYHQAF